MYSVLIVDDEQIVRIALKSIINWEEHNFSISGACGDGTAALDMVDELTPDIIITDLKMPRLDGIGLIKALKERGYPGKIIVLSNYGEFALVREAMRLGASDYLLKLTLKSEELLEILLKLTTEIEKDRERDRKQHFEKVEVKESRQVLKTGFFKDLLLKEITDVDAFLKRGEKLGVNFENANFYMLYIIIDNMSNILSTSKIDDIKLLLLSVTNIFSEIFGHMKHVEVIEIGPDRLIACVPCTENEEYEERAHQLSLNACRSIHTYLNISVSVTIGEKFLGLHQMRKVYDACIRSSELRFYLGYGSIIKQSGQGPEMPHFVPENTALQTASEIKKHLESGEFGWAFAELEKIFESAKKDAVVPGELKRHVRMIMEDAWELLAHWQISGNTSDDSFEDAILKSETIEEVHLLSERYLKSLSYKLEEVRRQKCRKEISLITDYLERHWDKKINLDMLAKQVNMNKSYICRMFKKEKNKSIVDYLNDLKMQKAYELLKQPDSTVKEVAAVVGIFDQFYFSRVFSKYYNISPSEFKKKVNSR